MTEPNTSSPPPTLPWLTLLIAAAAVALYFLPDVGVELAYDRTRVTQGQWWRLLTAHLVHFTPGQLVWNLAVLVPAGIWAERLEPVRARGLFLLAAVMVSGAVYAFEPLLGRYAGLSGLSAGMLAFLALAQLRLGAPDRWFWRSVLALLALRIVAEVAVASPWLAHLPDPRSRAIALAHLAGVVAALLALRLGRSRRRSA